MLQYLIKFCYEYNIHVCGFTIIIIYCVLLINGLVLWSLIGSNMTSLFCVTQRDVDLGLRFTLDTAIIPLIKFVYPLSLHYV